MYRASKGESMSIMYCDKHDMKWDSDIMEMCQRCEADPCGDGLCLVAEARGEQYRCQGKCAYEDEA